MLLIERRIILDLCGGTGSWSQSYAEAGYDVRIIDPKIGGRDVRLFLKPKEDIYGILAAPPCTVFASSGARWPRTDQDYIEGLSVVDACLRLVMVCKPKFWALENPVGKLVRWLGKPRMYFQPCDYGDPYTKRTCLWGEFNEPQQNRVEPEQGSKMHLQYGGKSDRTKAARSITPPGFARAFFEANQ